MRSISNDRPKVFEKVGNGSWYYNFNITKVTVEDQEGGTREEYHFDRVQVWNTSNENSLKKAVISDRYTESEEINLQNNFQRYALGLSKDEKFKSDYIEYLTEIDTLKNMVDADLKDHADDLK
jgi:hypothetical protein bfra3_11901|nr:MAG TPA: hypothetical protein [Caudoviricetes sp.]